MKNDAKNNVREWTEEDERKYREMLETPVKRLAEQEQFELGAVSPHPPLGACREKPQANENDKTPFFGDNDKFAQAITEAGTKAAKATHEFNMKETKNTEMMIEKVPPITSYGECTHPNRKCECRKDGKCPDAQMAIQFCRNCSYEDLQKAEEFAKALPHALKQIAEEKERVNHPKHYQHQSGVECITVARHHDFNIGNALKYLWRAGLKQEQGISPLEKQIEDLQKAAFYIQDEIKFLKSKQQQQ